MERYCPSCYAAVGKKSDICPVCGASLGDRKEVNRKLFILPIVVVILVAVSLFTVLLIDFTRTPEKTIQRAIVIDGEFEDWREVTTYPETSFSPIFNPDIDLVEYRIDSRDSYLSFYVRVDGEILAGEPGGEHVDTLYILVDTDQSPDTGYFIDGIGADYMLEIYGLDGEVVGSNCYRYTSTIQDWNLWTDTGSVEAASRGSGLETQIHFNRLFLSEGDNVDVLFYMQSWDRFEDFSEIIISNVEGVLSVTQQGIAQDFISGNHHSLLKLDLEAINSEITVTSIIAERTGLGSDGDVSSLRLEDSNGNPISTGTLTNGIATFNNINFFLTQGQSRTLYIVCDIGVSAQAENSIGFKIMNSHDIQTSTGTVSLESISPAELERTDNAYINYAPDDVRIDGAFADWNDEDLKNDNTHDVWKDNLDITRYGISSDSQTINFYLRVEGEIFGGTEVPFWNNITVTDPIVENDSPKTGEDVLYIFLDTINESGFNVIPGVDADYMIEVRGRHNQVLSHVYYQWFGNDSDDWDWIEMGSVSVACDFNQVEIGIRWDDLVVDPDIIRFPAFFTVMDWNEENFDTSDSYAAVPIR